MEREEYLGVLRRTDARFAEAAAQAVLARGWSAPVPGCPGWTLADLVWHLAEVQHFWAWVVRTRAQDPSEYVEPERRPNDELLAWQVVQSVELETALTRADPAERVWTWAPQKDVAFVLRRQVHEVVVHTVDAEQVLDDFRPVPTEVGLDGLDEWLEVWVPRALPNGPPENAGPVAFHAVDAHAERTLFAGAKPFPIATVTGIAGDLMLEVWRRVPYEVLTVDGDPVQATAMIELVELE
jgi:uncharacterized protein (TIGR03083 family)